MYNPNYNWCAPQGWTCPKCGRVYSPSTNMCFYCNNSVTVPAPTIGTPIPNDGEWWKRYTTVSATDSDTYRVHPESGPIYGMGGSDYWNPDTQTWENISKNISNLKQDLDELKSTFNSIKGE